MSDDLSETTAAGASAHRRRKIVVSLIKVVIACLILAFLFSRIDQESLRTIARGPKRIDLLLLAFTWVFCAHLITYIRWWQLVTSLGVQFPLIVAIRVGFLGTAFNLVSFGAVGGDLFKAVVASRSAPKKTPEVIASIIVDRIIGLVGLILVTYISIEAYARIASNQSGGHFELPPSLQIIRQYTMIASALALIGMFGLVCFGKHLPAHLLAKIPLVGSMSMRMAAAAHQFHGRPFLVLVQLGVSCGVHLCLTLGFYCVSRALSPDAPSLLQHLIVIPPSFAVAALPIMPGGAGLFEVAVVEIMQAVIGKDAPFMKVIVAVGIVYRLLLLLIAAIGGIYYLLGFGQLRADEQKRIGASKLDASQEKQLSTAHP
jgi:uncharacterized membrane protein YbhN (UPF0104 family)